MIDSNQEHFIRLRLEDFKRKHIIEDTELEGFGAYGVKPDDVKFTFNQSKLDLEVEDYDEGAAREYYFPLLDEFNKVIRNHGEQRIIVVGVGSDIDRTNMLMFDNATLHNRLDIPVFYDEVNTNTDDTTNAFDWAFKYLAGTHKLNCKLVDDVDVKLSNVIEKEEYIMQLRAENCSYKEEHDLEEEEKELISRDIGNYTAHNRTGMIYLFRDGYNVVKARGNIKLTVNDLLKEQLRLIELNKELYGKNT